MRLSSQLVHYDELDVYVSPAEYRGNLVETASRRFCSQDIRTKNRKPKESQSTPLPQNLTIPQPENAKEKILPVWDLNPGLPRIFFKNDKRKS